MICEVQLSKIDTQTTFWDMGRVALIHLGTHIDLPTVATVFIVPMLRAFVLELHVELQDCVLASVPKPCFFDSVPMFAIA